MTPFKSKKRRKNDRQYIWEYMRRNRIFKVEDVMLIVDDMSESSMKVFFKQLEHAGYIKVRIPIGKKTKPKRFRDRSYGFVKNSGALCPVWIAKQKRLYDRNTQEVQIRDTVYSPKVSKKIEHRPVKPMDYAKGRILQVFDFCEEKQLSLLVLSERSGVTGGQFSIALTSLKEEMKIKEVGSDGGVPLFEKVVPDDS
jgi:hypothetical protein